MHMIDGHCLGEARTMHSPFGKFVDLCESISLENLIYMCQAKIQVHMYFCLQSHIGFLYDIFDVAFYAEAAFLCNS